MKNIAITRTKNIAQATYLPYAAYKSALTLATAHKGEIGKTAEGNFKATFKTAKIAEQFVTEWTAEYNANRKVEVAPAKATAPAQKTSSSKPTASKGKKAPRKAKGNGIDFNAFKGTKSDKNKALHAMLVSKGITNSKSDEYMSVWNARPWAK